MSFRPSYPNGSVERLVTAAVAELQDSPLDSLSDDPALPGSRGTHNPPGECNLLDAVFFGDEGNVSYVPATSRPLSARWGEFLYDLSNSALAPWGDRIGGEQVRLIGILRLSMDEGHVFVRATSEMHVFKFPFDTWPSGMHMGAWVAICSYFGGPREGKLEHRYGLSGWV